MPPRIVCLLVCLCWLVTTGWLFQRDILPRFQDDEPPPFALNLADEAPRRVGSEVNWRITRGDDIIGYLRTRVEYDATDSTHVLDGRLSFSRKKDLRSTINTPGLGAVGGIMGPSDPLAQLGMGAAPAGPKPIFRRGREEEGDDAPPPWENHPRARAEGGLIGSMRAPEMEDPPVSIKSAYQVNLDGDLRMLTITLKTELVQDSVLDLPAGVMAELMGNIQAQFFTPTWWLQRAAGQRDVQLEPLKVSRSGVVLNPLQPVHRMSSLYLGQRWRVHFVNPLALANPDRRPEVQLLEALVQEDLFRTPRGEVDCFLVVQTGFETRVVTWVRKSDDTVLQQLVELSGQEFLLRRSSLP